MDKNLFQNKLQEFNDECRGKNNKPCLELSNNRPDTKSTAVMLTTGSVTRPVLYIKKQKNVSEEACEKLDIISIEYVEQELIDSLDIILPKEKQ